MRITNQSSFEFDLCEDTVVIESNEIGVEVVDTDCYRVEKTASCGYVAAGGEVTFCSTIRSTCTEHHGSAFTFKDLLAPEFEYLPGSFTVNGTHETPTVNGHLVEFHLMDSHWQNGQITICFRVRVL